MTFPPWAVFDPKPTLVRAVAGRGQVVQVSLLPGPLGDRFTVDKPLHVLSRLSPSRYPFARQGTLGETEKYLFQWFSILGTSALFRGKDLWYIDGFAGPGEYTNHPIGSPNAALDAAAEAIDAAGPRWAAGDVRCFFIEEEKWTYDHLLKRLDHRVDGDDLEPGDGLHQG